MTEKEKEQYKEVGWVEGYQVYVCYAKEGPDMEEAFALYQEARNSVLFQNLAAMGSSEMRKESGLFQKEEK